MRSDGRGVSPTSVTDDDPAATDADRRAVAAAVGTSHTAFLDPGRTPDRLTWTSVNAFTS
ncbi:hypothetical protein [Actinomadura bangladeshensis]|uniref:hypothetical protein n=1 Tax=Actinomadura bangladeshensis TaxID=453573 RepID=UPI001A9DDBE4|nr:hypothetical protein [Actinomadura bangladeshensis]